MITETEKEKLVILGHTKGCSLDGFPAFVSGIKEPFATVSRADGKGGRVEFSWETVNRVLDSDRGFKS